MLAKLLLCFASDCANFYSTEITALAQTSQTVFSRWQFHSVFPLGPCTASVQQSWSYKGGKRITDASWRTDSNHSIQGDFLPLSQWTREVVLFWKQSCEEPVFEPDGDANEQQFVPWKSSSSERPLRPVWCMRAARGEKGRGSLKFYAASVGFRASCWRKRQLGAILLLFCVTSGHFGGGVLFPRYTLRAYS